MASETVVATQKKKRRRATEGPRKYLTVKEMQRFFSAITDPRDTALFRVMYHYGLRASEPRLLQLSDFTDRRGEEHTLFVRRLKGSKSREFPLLPVVLGSLRAYVKVRGKAPGPLFLSRNGNPLGYDRVHELFKAYAAAAGVPAHLHHPHTLKHSCGTHIAAMRKNVLEVQSQLGHRNIANTMIYLEWTDESVAATQKELRDWR